MKILHRQFWGNSLDVWIIAALTAVVVIVFLRGFLRLLKSKLGRLAPQTRTEVDDLLLEILSRVKFGVIVVVGIYVGSLVLRLPPLVSAVVTRVAVVVLLLQFALCGNGVIAFFIERYVKRKVEEDASVATTFAAVAFMSKLVLWSVVLLLLLENLGVDISALVAGLGIGGVAVALAVQNILGDLFASLSITIDKPFVIGDFIVVGDYLGTVEHIGLKTTRIRSLSGEQIVFSNSDLLKSRIRNYKRMFERRVVFNIGVTYQTPYEKLRRIPEIIRRVVESQDGVRFDRAHFKEFGDFALVFEVVYYVLNPDYKFYMDVQQAINLELFRRFEQEGIEFAYPTQTVFVEGALGDRRQEGERV